jgi:hypothetical protein
LKAWAKAKLGSVADPARHGGDLEVAAVQQVGGQALDRPWAGGIVVDRAECSGDLCVYGTVGRAAGVGSQDQQQQRSRVDRMAVAEPRCSLISSPMRSPTAAPTAGSRSTRQGRRLIVGRVASPGCGRWWSKR